MTSFFRHAALLLCAVLALAPTAARADLFSLSASGTISFSSSGAATIPLGTPWTFQLIYDTAAPDLDFEVTGSPTPTFGRFTNTGAAPALISFHYRAGDYEVSIDDPAEFGAGSEILTTFTGVHAIDINVHAAGLFPPLGGQAVSFHADFNDFSSRPIFVSDALPTNPALGPDSFDANGNTVALLFGQNTVSSSSLTGLTVRAVPEPSTLALASVGLLLLLVAAGRRLRPSAH
jgi:hypothetical protein